MRMRAHAMGVGVGTDEVSLVELATEIARDATEAAALRGIRLRLDVRSRPLVRGCRGSLARALGNLVDNAIRHGPRRRVVQLVIDDARREGRIEVRDGGAGVPEPLRERVFEPFVALKPGSDGLGLTVARAAVMAHGGRVHFVAGNRVRIELPCHARQRVH